jgi:hypothetical protein
VEFLHYGHEDHGQNDEEKEHESEARLQKEHEEDHEEDKVHEEVHEEDRVQTEDNDDAFQMDRAFQMGRVFQTFSFAISQTKARSGEAHETRDHAA